jgi:hypothetical protein
LSDVWEEEDGFSFVLEGFLDRTDFLSKQQRSTAEAYDGADRSFSYVRKGPEGGTDSYYEHSIYVGVVMRRY